MQTTQNASYDSAWKDVLDFYLPQAMQWCFPSLYELIDWKRPYLSLDKELQAITKNAQTGQQYADKLLRVFLNDGTEQWILILLEVQHWKSNDFCKRMFLYASRCFDKYQRPIAACALLADSNKKWRPNFYEIKVAESKLRIDFMVCKIMDLHPKIKELESSNHPFSVVLLSQLKLIRAGRISNNAKLSLKLHLVKALLRKKLSRLDVHNVFRFIDYVIALPEDLQIKYDNVVHQIEQEIRMPYISTTERRSMERGLQKGLQKGAENTAREIAIKLLQKGSDLTFVSEITGLDIKALNALQANSAEHYQ